VGAGEENHDRAGVAVAAGFLAMATDDPWLKCWRYRERTLPDCEVWVGLLGLPSPNQVELMDIQVKRVYNNILALVNIANNINGKKHPKL